MVRTGAGGRGRWRVTRVPGLIVALAQPVTTRAAWGGPSITATYNQDYTISRRSAGRMALWRLEPGSAPGTGDMLAHAIDTAEWLNGPCPPRDGHTETSSRAEARRDGQGRAVTIDDAASLPSSPRLDRPFGAPLRPGAKYNFEINASRGLFFDLEDPHILQ